MSKLHEPSVLSSVFLSLTTVAFVLMALFTQKWSKVPPGRGGGVDFLYVLKFLTIIAMILEQVFVLVMMRLRMI